jgi:hypothetical protein
VYFNVLGNQKVAAISSWKLETELNNNFAHQQARGQYLTQLDNDNNFSPDKLERQVAIMRHIPISE